MSEPTDAGQSSRTRSQPQLTLSMLRSLSPTRFLNLPRKQVSYLPWYLTQTRMELANHFANVRYEEDERMHDALVHRETSPWKVTAGIRAMSTGRNRYANIIPYDKNRVRLNSVIDPGNEDARYINASTIDVDLHDIEPRSSTKHYIATQGPTRATVVDFWQMVYESCVTPSGSPASEIVIVMVTPLAENGIAKCFQYWPDKSQDSYLLDVDRRAFVVRAIKGGESRTELLCDPRMNRDGFFDEEDDEENDSGSDANPNSPTGLEPVFQRALLLTLQQSHHNDGHFYESTLTLMPKDSKDPADMKTVHHLYFDQWADFDKPESMTGVLKLIERVNELRYSVLPGNTSLSPHAIDGPESRTNSTSSFSSLLTDMIPRPKLLRSSSAIALPACISDEDVAPLIVHCSAGVGRSGTYIALDYLFTQCSDYLDHEVVHSAPASEVGSPVLSPTDDHNIDSMLDESVVDTEKAAGETEESKTISPIKRTSNPSQSAASTPSSPIYDPMAGENGEETKPDVILEIVRRLRQQRMQTVQSRNQFFFLYDLAREYFSKVHKELGHSVRESKSRKRTRT